MVRGRGEAGGRDKARAMWSEGQVGTRRGKERDAQGAKEQNIPSTPTHRYARSHARTHARTHACVCVIREGTFASERYRVEDAASFSSCAHEHTHTHTHTHVHTRTHTCTHARTHARTHTHTYIHSRTHTHTHTSERAVWVRLRVCMCAFTLVGCARGCPLTQVRHVPFQPPPPNTHTLAR